MGVVGDANSNQGDQNSGNEMDLTNMAAGIVNQVDSAVSEMTSQMTGTPEEESVAGDDNALCNTTINLE